jgi:hypothetical protein
VILKLAGNLCVGLALLLYAIPLPLGISAPRSHDGGQSEAWYLLFLMVLLWFCLAVALCASAANGAFDWLAAGRGSQYALVLVTCLAMAVVTTLSGMLRRETADQIPWAVRPLVPFAWAMWIFPLAAIFFALLTLNPGLGSAVPRLALRVPLGLAGGISLLASFGMLAQWFVSSQQRQAARVDAILSEASERSKQQMEDLRKYDANTQLSFVLSYTNRYNDPPIRELALEKIRAVPDLEEQLIAGLRSPWYESVLIYLDAEDPPEGKRLAEPARDAFLLQAEATRETIRAAATLYPDCSDFEARLVLSVADKFRTFGVDYAPAIRAFRSAFDEPHDPKVKFTATARLDDWLAHDAKRPK